MDQINDIFGQGSLDWLIDFGKQVLVAVGLLVAGLWIIKKVLGLIRMRMEAKSYDPSLMPFLLNLTSGLLKVILFIAVASQVGIETTSFIAVLGAAGLAIGLALQGSLANFAAGVMILLFKPFKVGDVIDAQGVIASVTEIQIFHTVLKSYDNKTIILPNGPLYNDKIINYTTEPTRKVEWVFGIGYNDDIDKAKEIIKKVIFSDERILDADTPFINVSELGDSAVNIKVRALAKGEDFWDLFFEKTEAIKKAFDAEGVSIPFPQRDVHLFQEK